jgi:hypothetical protein
MAGMLARARQGAVRDKARTVPKGKKHVSAVVGGVGGGG